jgi:cobalt-zinc-cadmium efflux system protein
MAEVESHIHNRQGDATVRHTHHHHPNATTGNIRIAFFLNLFFAIVEIIGGIYTNSLAIISDAIHDLGDSLALGAAWFLEKKSQAGGDEKYSYGYRRFSLLGALISSLVLVAGSALILAKAIPRLMNPQHSNAQGMIVFAIAGVLINGIAALRLRKDSSYNARIVGLHLLEDVLGWLAILIMAIVLLFKDIRILDPLFSIGITLFVLFNVFRNLKGIFKVFLQAIPDDVDLSELEKNICALPKVESVHNTHVWSLDGTYRILTTHIMMPKDATRDEILDVKCRVKEIAYHLHFEHVTVDIEYGEDECLIKR